MTARGQLWLGLAACVLLGVAVAVPKGWPVALAAAGAVLLVAGMLTAPAAILLAFVATRPIADAFVRVSVGPLSLGQVWSAVLIVAVLVCIGRLPREEGTRPWYDIIPMMLIAVYAVLTLWRPNEAMAVGNTTRLIAWVLLIEAVARIALLDKSIRRILWSGRALGMVAIAAVALSTARGEYGLGYYYNPARFSDFLMSGPHGLAALCILSMGFPLVAVTIGRGTPVDVPLACALAACALLSLTRTSMLALVAVAVGVVAAGLWGRRASLVAAVISVVLVAGGVVYYLGDRFIGRVLANTSGSFIASQLAPTGGSGRIGIWESLQSRIVGDFAGLFVGYGAAATTQISQATLGIALLAHNDVLELLTTGGLGLVLVYVAMFWWMWLQLGLQGQNRRATVIVGRSVLVAYGVFSLFNGIVFSQASIALGLFVGMMRGQRLLDEAGHEVES